MNSVPEAASRFLKFVNASPTPFHAVHNAAAHLERAGFRKVQSTTMTTKVHSIDRLRSEKRTNGKARFNPVENTTSPGTAFLLAEDYIF